MMPAKMLMMMMTEQTLLFEIRVEVLFFFVSFYEIGKSKRVAKRSQQGGDL